MTLRKFKHGKALGVERCHSIVTDERAPSMLEFARAAGTVAERWLLGASNPLTGPIGPLSRSLLPKNHLSAIPGVSMYKDMA